MKSFKVALAAVAAIISLVSLSGCTSNGETTNYVPVPKAARYATGLSVDKRVVAITNERNTIVTAISAAVGTANTSQDKNSLIYNNIATASYDLGANSPYFINKSRTATKCDPGKAQGTDIGEGYYVIADAFITPTGTSTLAAGSVNSKLNTVVKALIKNKTIKTAYDKARLGDGKFEFTTKGGNTVRVKSTVNGSNATVIRVSDVLTPTTCYNLNGLPFTTPDAVKAWQQADSKAGAF